MTGHLVLREWSFPQDAHLTRNARRNFDIYIEDDSFALNPKGGDVAIVSPHSSPYVRDTVKRPKCALMQAEQKKHKTYGVLCQPSEYSPNGIDLHPIAFDLCGS
eukprot:IDg9246t1